MGPEALIATEVGVVLHEDAAHARDLARQAVALYVGFPNYTNNWRRLGFSDDEIATLADRLIDAIFAWGSTDRIKARVDAYFDAGADHVCLQVVRGRFGEHPAPPIAEWR